jgi:hexulose-6-phosphate isomerase
MKKSLGPGYFCTPTLEEAFKKAQELNIDGFEFMLTSAKNNPLYITYESDENTYAQIRKLCEIYRIEAHSVTTTHYNTTGASFGSPKGSEKYNEALKILRKQLECAKGIGADAILVVTNIDPETGYLESIENTIATFRELEDEIKEIGVNIGIENITNHFFMSPLDVKYVIEKIDNPLVGFYFDAGNVLEFSPIDYWIDTVGKYIKKVHIKDFKRNFDEWDIYNVGGTSPDLLEGDMDFELLVKKLQAVGYDGFLSAEVGNSKEGRTREQFVIDLSNQLEKIVSFAK